MANKGRVMNVGATKRERPWSEKPETPTKFRAGVGGPGCICCRKVMKPEMKRLRNQMVRRRAKAELRKGEDA